jgi:hypothetical protein
VRAISDVTAGGTNPPSLSARRRDPFLEGTTRVAVAAEGLPFELNGWRLEAEVEDTAALVLEVAGDQRSKKEIRIRLEQQCIPRRTRGNQTLEYRIPAPNRGIF